MLNLSEAPARLIAQRFAPISDNSPEPQKLSLNARIAALRGTKRGEKVMLSLSEAATAAGIAKSTIWRAIKVGKISAIRTGTGSYQIDPAELFTRVSCNAKKLRNETTGTGHRNRCSGSTGRSNQSLERGEQPAKGAA
jgi:excisionase family DNA binding protein